MASSGSGANSLSGGGGSATVGVSSRSQPSAHHCWSLAPERVHRRLRRRQVHGAVASWPSRPAPSSPARGRRRSARGRGWCRTGRRPSPSASPTASRSARSARRSASASGHSAATSWPSASSIAAAERVAATQSSWRNSPCGWVSSTPMRSRPGSAPTSSAYGRAGGGAITVSPTPGPRIASSMHRGVAHRPAHAVLDAQAGLGSHRADTGAALARLETDQPAARRRDADAAAAVRSVGERHHPGGDRRGGAAAGAAGRAVEIPRVARRPPRDRLGRRQAAHLGTVGPPGDHQAGGLEAGDERGVGRVDPAPRHGGRRCRWTASARRSSCRGP